MRDPSSRRSRGFGFVTYVEAESVEALMADGPQQSLQGRTVEVKRAMPRRAATGAATPPVAGGRGAASRAGRGQQGGAAQGTGGARATRQSRRSQRGARDRAASGKAGKSSAGQARAAGSRAAPAAAPHVNVWEVKARQAAAAAAGASTAPPSAAAASAVAGNTVATAPRSHAAQLAGHGDSGADAARDGGGARGSGGRPAPPHARPTDSPTSRASAPTQPQGVAGRKIFVGGLHYNTDDGAAAALRGVRTAPPAAELLSGLNARCAVVLCVLAAAEQLESFFSAFGSVESVQVMYNRETRKSRGFGFVIFDSPGSVDVVLQQRMHTINDKQVRTHTHALPAASTLQRRQPRTCVHERPPHTHACWHYTGRGEASGAAH